MSGTLSVYALLVNVLSSLASTFPVADANMGAAAALNMADNASYVANRSDPLGFSSRARQVVPLACGTSDGERGSASRCRNAANRPPLAGRAPRARAGARTPDRLRSVRTIPRPARSRAQRIAPPRAPRERTELRRAGIACGARLRRNVGTRDRWRSAPGWDRGPLGAPASLPASVSATRQDEVIRNTVADNPRQSFSGIAESRKLPVAESLKPLARGVA